jgi:hypothetical protein
MHCFEHLQPVFMPNGAIERAYDSYNTRKIFMRLYFIGSASGSGKTAVMPH